MPDGWGWGMIYIGIDPGGSGGIAVIRPELGEVMARPMPETDRELLNFLGPYRPVDGKPIAFAVLERVWSSPGWGHVGAFKFGMSYGGLRMALAAQRIPFEEALPKRWQQVMGVTYPKRTDGKARDKNITKARAEALFPSLTVTHAIADALLIASFCRRLHRSAADGKESVAAFGLGVKTLEQSKSELAQIRGRIAERQARAQAGAAVGRVAGHGSRAKSATR